MEQEGFMGEALQAVHPFDALRPEECNFMWELSFLTVNYSAWWEVPNYTALFYRTDPTLIYQEQRQVLQQRDRELPAVDSRQVRPQRRSAHRGK